jgi:hypothetical protein
MKVGPQKNGKKAIQLSALALADLGRSNRSATIDQVNGPTRGLCTKTIREFIGYSLQSVFWREARPVAMGEAHTTHRIRRARRYSGIRIR